MSFSIYSQWFNIEKSGFKWRETLDNWVEFLGTDHNQIVIAVNKSEDDTAALVRKYLKEIVDVRSHLKADVIDIDIPYTDPAFDGKGKAAALAACTEPYCILLDADEVLYPNQRAEWLKLAIELEHHPNFDAFFIPVVDIIQDDQHYKGIGSKFYLHRNSSNITRGVWAGGKREDGTIDITKSDTTELIYKDTGQLVRAHPLLMQGLPPYIIMAQLESGVVPMVIHLGWKNLEQRLKQSAFWEPVWSNRDGKPVKTERTLEELEKIPKYRHMLPKWRAGG